MCAPAPPRFGVLVPVKPVARAKSRLGALGDVPRRSLVAAFAADTVAAALTSPLVETVLVVTDDHELAAALVGLGADVMPDGASLGLNASLVQGCAELLRRRPGIGVAALCADLPALRTDDLTRALEVAGHHQRSFVADRAGAGTTLVTALTADAFTPQFGPGSRAAHVAAGLHHVEEVEVPSLRLDVDTPEDLVAAVGLGVGVRTSEVASGLRL